MLWKSPRSVPFQGIFSTTLKARTSFAHEYATIGKGNTEYIYVRVIQRITSEGVFMIEAWFISAVNDCHLNHLWYIASRCDCDWD